MKNRSEESTRNHDNAVTDMANAISHAANHPRKPRIRKNADNGNAAFAHDPNDHLANGLQAQFEEYKNNQA